MNNNNIQAFVQTILQIVGGYEVAHGTMTANQEQAIVGGAVALVGFIWSQLHHMSRNRAQAPISIKGPTPNA